MAHFDVWLDEKDKSIGIQAETDKADDLLDEIREGATKYPALMRGLEFSTGVHGELRLYVKIGGKHNG